MCPARATVLRYVLIERLGEIVGPRDIAPIPIWGQVGWDLRELVVLRRALEAVVVAYDTAVANPVNGLEIITAVA